LYPILFEIFGFQVSSFGLMMAIGFLVGTWITAVRMEEDGLDPELAWSILLWVMLGGVAGSKLYFAVDTWLREGQPFFSLVFAREGITWYGGLIAGTVVGAIGCRVNGISWVRFANCGCIGAAIGQAIGRVGCFLVGDDYGRVSDVPWAVAFPEGSPVTLETVHPTQLYETVWLLVVAAFLWRRRKASPFLFGEYLALNGMGRFVIEMWRVNPKVALGWTEPQWIGVGLVVLGVTGWVYHRMRPTKDAAPTAEEESHER
jgi:phosphatidylglycerol:prolipoprotein diacylglycerol transferase